MGAPGGTRTPGGDWPAETADSIERLVQTIRSKTTVPAVTIARAVVYGVVVATAGLVAVVVFAIALVRAIDVLLPTWAAHLVVGALFVLVGLIVWAKASPKTR